MIIVSVDLKSAVHPSRDKHLATLHICNIGGGLHKRDYSIQAYGPSGKPGKRGEIKDYPAEDVAVLNMVRRAIEAAGYTK